LGCQAKNISRFTTFWRLIWIGLSAYKHIKVYYPLALGLLDCQVTNISRFSTLWRLACWIGRLQTYQGLLPFGAWGCQATNISPLAALLYYTIYNCESSLVHIIKFYQIWSKEKMLVQSY